MTYQSKLNIKGVNIIYLFAMVLLITAGSFAQAKSFRIGILITEFVLIALPAFIYVLMKKGSIKEELRFNKLSFLEGLLVAFIFICGYPVAMLFSIIGNIFVALFGKLIQSPIPVASNFNEYFVLLLIVAGSAGICEELLFRGLIMRGYQNLGKWHSIVFTAVLFSMLHINIQNVLGPLFLGIVLGYVVYTTNSIFAGMIGHFMNNAISVTVSFLIMQLPMAKNAPMQDISQGMMLQGLILWAVILSFVAIIPGLIMFFCLKGLKELRMERDGKEAASTEPEKKESLKHILKIARISWPLYVATAIFIFYAILEFAYVIMGQSLFDIIL